MSRHAPFSALWMLPALFAAGGAFAEDGAAPPAADAAPAAPVIEVVRDGGIAESWREDGSAFATFGPDGEAVVPTAEQQALQALANAYDVRFVRYDAAGADEATVAGDTIARYALAREVAAEALKDAKPAAGGAATRPTHALAYSSDGHAWELQLCFDCERYLLRRDGVEVGAGASGGTTRRAAFDALFAGADAAR